MRDPRAYATFLVDHYLGARLDAADNPPGLRETVVDLVAEAIPQHVERLVSAQLDLLGNPGSRLLPDAYLADQAATEDGLQQAAAGLRAALAQTGRILDALNFERGAAARLRDDPQAALRAELARVPRPQTRPRALEWSLDPVPWLSDSHHEEKPWPPEGLAQVSELRALPDGPSAFSRIKDGPHADWVQIGIVEQHHTPARSYPNQPSRKVLLIIGLEAVGDDPPSDTLPMSTGTWQVWVHPWRRLVAGPRQPHMAAEYIGAKDQPVVALTDAGTTGLVDTGRRVAGLGLPPYVLAPTVSLVAALDLEPTGGVCGFSLSDVTGEAVTCRQWRGHLVHDGNYEPLVPAIAGADLLIRPDLFTRLVDVIGPARCRAGVSVHHMSATEDDAFDDG